MQKEKLILSICIPTYNRIGILKKTIVDILQCPSSKFEIVVVDNKSPDDTCNVLKSIDDKRLRVIENDTNIGAYLNGIRAMKAASGKYVFVMLDKDRINEENLEWFINLLEQKEYSAGYCELNYESIQRVVREYSCGMEAVLAIGYHSKHPSGHFFRNTYLQEILPLYESKEDYGFLVDILCGELGVMKLPAVHVLVPLVYTEKRSECGKTQSYSVGEPFFFPTKRYEIYSQYLESILSLNIGEYARSIILGEIFWRYLLILRAARYIGNDEDILGHYNVTRQQLYENTRNRELFKCFFKLVKRLFYINSRKMYVSIGAIIGFCLCGMSAVRKKLFNCIKKGTNG